jgi:hypothetical protein
MLRGTRVVSLVALGTVSLALALNVVGAAEGGAEPAAAPDPGGFVAVIDNAYLPLRPGTVFTYTGVKDGQAERDVVEVTSRTTVVQGVTCVVVLDNVSTADGQPIERTEDWYAQDRAGNVWYFGEDSFDFVHGHWRRNDGSWTAGVHGAQAGIVMEARPMPGDSYQQEFYAGHAEDQAQVLGWLETVTVPAGTFHHALETKEFTALEPGIVDHKRYARGVGFIQSFATSGESEHFELVDIQPRGH